MNKIKGEAYMGIDRFPSAGPSQSQSVDNAPSTSGDEGLIIPPDHILDFDALDDTDFEGAIDNGPVNSQLGSVEPLTAISAQRPLKFRTEYHPFIGREPLHQAFNEFDIDTHPEEQLPVNKEPWCDFEFAEITLDAALNKSHINGLLSLIGRISRGETQMMLKSDSDLQKAWEHATNQATPSHLPPGLKAALFCFILYADKTRLSFHGTVKAYPVVVSEDVEQYHSSISTEFWLSPLDTVSSCIVVLPS
ncbi:hypothetical protein EV424DRAFT_1346720 [Suillus variegatus]|nr:hypothetical protein EV424DRAFT_1346720 [Suillus variegatus]